MLEPRTACWCSRCCRTSRRWRPRRQPHGTHHGGGAAGRAAPLVIAFPAEPDGHVAAACLTVQTGDCGHRRALPRGGTNTTIHCITPHHFRPYLPILVTFPGQGRSPSPALRAADLRHSPFP